MTPPQDQAARDLAVGDTAYQVGRWDYEVTSMKVLRVTKEFYWLERRGWGDRGRRFDKSAVFATVAAAHESAIREAERKVSLAEAEWQRAKDNLRKRREAAQA